MVAIFPPGADDVRRYKGMVVAVCGPPHSGKSIFLAELYRQLLSRKPSDVFLQRACPDGEGMWSAESDPSLSAKIRRKGSFSEEFMLFTLKSIENLGKKFKILLLDLGGRRTAENAEILRRATHVIILSPKEEEDELWQEFATTEGGCVLLGIFRSLLVRRGDGALDNTARSSIDLSEPVRGIIVNLDRESPAEPYREAISQFADWLIAKTNSI